MNKIYFKNCTFYDDEMRIEDLHIEDSLTRETFGASTITIRINTKDPVKMAALQSAQYGDYIDFYRSGNGDYEAYQVTEGDFYVRVSEEIQLGEKFLVQPYTTEWKWVDRFFLDAPANINSSLNAFRLTGYNFIGLWINKAWDSWFFTQAAGETVAGALTMLGQNGYPVSVNASAITGMPVITGFLPRMSRRDAAQKIMFAYGISVRPERINNSEMRASFYLNTGSTLKQIGDEYIGGERKEITNVSKITLYEHTYIADTSIQTEAVADNTASTATGLETIFFDEPVISNPFYVKDENGNIVYEEDADGNVVIDTGVWSRGSVNPAWWDVVGKGVIYAKKYTHVETPVSWTNPDYTGIANEIVVKDNYLINPLNSANILERLKRYYCGASELKNSFVMNDADLELPGDKVSLIDAFKVQRTAFIEESDITPSGIIKSVSKLIADWIPGPFGSTYNHVDIITEDNPSYTPPAGKIMVVLIGGGQGGQGGQGGGNGTGGDYAGNNGTFGNGGRPGVGGNGGNILVVTIDNPSGTYPITIGRGGAKGVGGTAGQDGTLGTAGEATTFGSYSSASGSPSDTGYQNLLSTDSYALPGLTGKAYGKNGGAVMQQGGDFYYAADDVSNSGGMYGVNRERDAFGDHAEAHGSGGGGAAYGNDGGDGTSGVITDAETSYGDRGLESKGGDGGDGADATNETDAGQTAPGCGGRGGSGGGGAGAGGGVIGNPDLTNVPGVGGVGGRGGDGTPGNDGCIFVYSNQ